MMPTCQVCAGSALCKRASALAPRAPGCFRCTAGEDRSASQLLTYFVTTKAPSNRSKRGLSLGAFEDLKKLEFDLFMCFMHSKVLIILTGHGEGSLGSVANSDW